MEKPSDNGKVESSELNLRICGWNQPALAPSWLPRSSGSESCKVVIMLRLEQEPLIGSAGVRNLSSWA